MRLVLINLLLQTLIATGVTGQSLSPSLSLPQFTGSVIPGGIFGGGSDLDNYLGEFVDDLASNYPQYVTQYSAYLETHVFSYPAIFTSDFSALFGTGTAAFTDFSALTGEFETAYYDVITQYPWFSKFAATATVSKPSVGQLSGGFVVLTNTISLPTTISGLSQLGSAIQSAASAAASRASASAGSGVTSAASSAATSETSHASSAASITSAPTTATTPATSAEATSATSATSATAHTNAAPQGGIRGAVPLLGGVVVLLFCLV
jgi:hypothetical protein